LILEGHLEGSGLGRALAALAAVLPQVVCQRAERVVIGGVVVERAFLPADEHPGFDQPLQVMA